MRTGTFLYKNKTKMAELAEYTVVQHDIFAKFALFTLNSAIIMAFSVKFPF